ncbi:MAG: GIY-YIG nuclease family protein [Ignavibacteriae bacterium]|nr:GIY-YIG nuclease family protein [Ignavibacteriota bacterium]
MFFVYVIKSKRGLTYTGQTQDLDRRVVEHNHGKSKWTSQDENWELVYSKAFETRSEAIRHERWLKSGVGRDFLREIMVKTSKS